MKIVYSDLKTLIPGLNVPIRKLANDLTLIGHFAEGIEKVKSESILSLEVRQNRGDCLGYWGIARDLAVFYQLPLAETKEKFTSLNNYKLPIKVKANQETKRIMAIKLTGLQNKPSPIKLKRFLELNGINSINTVVDLTNFIMLWYGIPSHAFDTQESTDQLVWEINNNKYKQITTLDGTNLKLKKDNLIITNNQKVLSLGMIGGQNCAIGLKTKELILEMAIYDRVQIRRDSRELKIITEAGLRLEKELDTELIPQAFNHLINLILKSCGGEIASQTFDYYPYQPVLPEIKFDLQKPGQFAGIKIPVDFARNTLNRLGCQLKSNGQSVNLVKVIPPSLRKDLNLEEDLIEEVIRFWGYNKIPVNQPISKKQLTDVTPDSFYLNMQLKEKLVLLGYDEIRSWPLIKKSHFYPNKTINLKRVKKIYTENNINSHYPLLRQSIVSSLINQQEQLEKFKVKKMELFEIGKVFYQHENEYLEHHSLGILSFDRDKLGQDLKQLFKELKMNPPRETSSVGMSDFPVRIEPIKNVYLAEINLKNLLERMATKPEKKLINHQNSPRSTRELTKQIITLDANLTFDSQQKETRLMEHYLEKIGSGKVWQIQIVDVFPVKQGFKYTLRVSYYNLTQKQARTIHLKTFNLNREK